MAEPRAPRVKLGKFLYFKKKYVERLLSGGKVTTIRRGIVTPTRDRVYLACNGRVLGEARISSLRFVKLGDLTDSDAKRDGFKSKEELVEALREIYPDITKEDWVTVITLEDITRYSRPMAVEDLRSLPGEKLAELSRAVLSHGLATTLEEKRFFALLSLGRKLEDAAREVGFSLREAKKVVRRAIRVLNSREALPDEPQGG